jgi:hydroxyacylglutathione hydrolase
MILKNFYDNRLAQASYLVGCEGTGEAIVIDPLRHPEPYLEEADRLGLRIVGVTETHIHADYLSGSRELAERTGARLYLSDEGTADWKYAYADQPNVTLLRDGDSIRVGAIELRALHTPGHTPEHLAFLLFDHARGTEPVALFSGDFVFVGDVGRPDLLERAAHVEGTMVAGARQLFHSLRRLDSFSDGLLIWPGHGAGSACGKSLGGSPVTSLGYERATNWAFAIQSEDKFVEEVLAGQPEPPLYFAEMKKLNRLGPALLSQHRVPELSTVSGQLVDIRGGDEIRADFKQGSLAIPLSKSFATWAGWTLRYDQPITLVANTQQDADQALEALQLIGLDSVVGWVRPEFIPGGRPIAQTTCSQIQPACTVVDVRGSGERSTARIEGSTHVPLGYLRDWMSSQSPTQRLVVHCQSGGRSLLAASLLLSAGFENVAELSGGLSQAQERCPEVVLT